MRNWETCDRCVFASGRKVHYRGSKKPTVLFVASTLEQGDTITGVPLGGLGGRLLDSICATVGLNSYGVTSIVSCHPHDPETPSLSRKATEEEIKNCSERLEEVVELMGAEFYITLGPLAKKWLPEGIKPALEFSCFTDWISKGEETSLCWKRDRHKLRKFIVENREKKRG